MPNLNHALKILEDLVSNNNITNIITQTETALNDKTKEGVVSFLQKRNDEGSILKSALRIKKITGQINVIIHAWGILISLPHILEKDEKIISLSLGAGNTGKDFDLETNQRVAEFKFIEWQGGSEAIRQNNLFKDFFYLVKNGNNKKRYLYLLDTDIPEKFLSKSRRAISSMVSKNDTLKKEFYKKYGKRFSVISEYYREYKDMVNIINLRDIVPEFKNG